MQQHVQEKCVRHDVPSSTGPAVTFVRTQNIKEVPAECSFFQLIFAVLGIGRTCFFLR